MIVVLVIGIVLAAVALLLVVLGLVDLAFRRREQRRAAERQAVVLLGQQRMRAVTRASLEAMRDAARTGLPNGKWSGQ